MNRLSREEIIRALQALSGELGENYPHDELVIAGGAALVLLYGARDSTRDVDTIMTSAAVRSAAKRVAEQLGLPDDWLNDGVKGFVQGLAVGEVVLETPSLTVRTLAPHQLLAMKLCAWRDDIDIADARLLLSRIVGTKDDVWRSVEQHLVPGRQNTAYYAFEDLWESLHGSS